jgi:calcium-dependent protein kinase
MPVATVRSDDFAESPCKGASPAGSAAKAVEYLAEHKDNPQTGGTPPLEVKLPNGPSTGRPQIKSGGGPADFAAAIDPQKEAAWAQFIATNCEAEDLDDVVLDRIVGLAVRVEDAVMELLSACRGASLPSEKSESALSKKLFPQAVSKGAAERGSLAPGIVSKPRSSMLGGLGRDLPAGGLGGHRQSSNHAGQTGLMGSGQLAMSTLEETDGDAGEEMVLSTTKLAMVFDHNNSADHVYRRGSVLTGKKPAGSILGGSLALDVGSPSKRSTTRRNSEPDVCMARQSIAFSGGGESPRGGVTGLSLGGCLVLCKHVKGGPSQIYEMDEIVGSGTFGSVRRAKHRKSGASHAVKAIPKQLILESDLWNEINMMKLLDHPHIMRLHYTFEDTAQIYIASEMCSGGELFDAIEQSMFFSEGIAAALMRQCMSAVTYLHQKYICHRDLKPENYLLSKKVKSLTDSLGEVKVKLIDFGTASRFDLNAMTTKVCTVYFVAPEVLKRNMDPYTEKVDIWSAGVMLFMMLCGQGPFHHHEDREVLKLVKKGKLKFEPAQIWANISECAKAMVRSMICKEVENRYNAHECMDDDWLNQRDTGETGQSVQLMDEAMLNQMKAFRSHNKLKKVALQVIARQMNDSSIDELADLFSKMDADQSGTLDMTEMVAVLSELDLSEGVQADFMTLLAGMAAGSPTGEIVYTEFIASTIKEKHYRQEEVLKAAFHMMDRDCDGVINKSDMAEMLGLDDNSSAQQKGEVDSMMLEIDEDGDGTINYEEFMVLMQEKDLVSNLAEDQVARMVDRSAQKFLPPDTVAGDQAP